MDEVKNDSPPTLAEILENTRQEYEQIKKELKEIDLLIRQSTSEVEKLAQRNAQIANKVRSIEHTLDTIPRQDIKEMFTASNEAQQRLFMMRNQVEQLQSKRQYLERYAQSIQRILEASGSSLPGSSQAGGNGQPQMGASGTTIIRIINAQESERQHLSRQMHDGPAQSLTNLILQAEICERLFATDPARAQVELGNLKKSVTSTFQKVREFIFELRPMMLDDLGLSPTLKRYVQDFETKSGLACNLMISGEDQRLPPHAEVTIFRVIQGLLNNIHDHANASHVQISLELGRNRVDASVEDDGSGFDAEEALIASRQRKTMGLSTMQDQVEMIGGQITYDSSVGRGTKVSLWLPVS
jgi:two-component system, NarL family, sensor histidine kinase DegS